MLQIDECIEVRVDQFDKRICGDVDIGVVCTDHVADTLEDESGLSSEEIKWDNKHILNALLLVFHAGQESCRFEETTNIFAWLL